MVSDSSVWHFNTNCRFVLYFKAAKKAHNAKPGNMVVEFLSGSAVGTRLVTKTMPLIAYCLELTAIGRQGCPGKLFSFIFIDFISFH